MTTRAAIVAKALSFNGYENGYGYDCPNEFSADLGRSSEAWCADFATDIFKRVGLPLPPMQQYCRTGFASVPDGVAAAESKNAFLRSWQALPADIIVVGHAAHVEIVTGWKDNYLYTIGGNSGPSDVDQYVGEGGVHRHVWDVPTGIGDIELMGVIAMGSFVAFGAAPIVKPPPKPVPCPFRLLMLKTPLMHGSDVAAAQEALNITVLNPEHPKLTVDGIYGPLTRDDVAEFQMLVRIPIDGIVGCQTRAALGMAH